MPSEWGRPTEANQRRMQSDSRAPTTRIQAVHGIMSTARAAWVARAGGRVGKIGWARERSFERGVSNHVAPLWPRFGGARHPAAPPLHAHNKRCGQAPSPQAHVTYTRECPAQGNGGQGAGGHSKMQQKSRTQEWGSPLLLLLLLLLLLGACHQNYTTQAPPLPGKSMVR
jgi:hypothetical protein